MTRKALLLMILSVAAVLLLPMTAQGRQLRTLQSGDCGLDVQHVNEHLSADHFLPPGSHSSCFDDATYYAVIAYQKWYGLDRDGVVGPQTRRAIETRPKPYLSAKHHPDVDKVVINIKKQVLVEIKHGHLYRIIAVSTGMPGLDTPTGTYSVFRKERMSWSVPYSSWMPYASYFNGGIATHQYPEVPTYPASHGCVRVPAPFAVQLYHFEVIGMTVQVV